MNSDPPSVRVRLSDDGELLDGKFCAHCGEISIVGIRVCAYCGEPFPVPLTALRLRLEALSRSEGKKKEHPEPENKLEITFIFWAPLIVLILIIQDLRALFLDS